MSKKVSPKSKGKPELSHELSPELSPELSHELSELERYKKALSKIQNGIEMMESQWKQAISQIIFFNISISQKLKFQNDETALQSEVNSLEQQLQVANNQLIEVKQQNQQLKLQIHLIHLGNTGAKQPSAPTQMQQTKSQSSHNNNQNEQPKVDMGEFSHLNMEEVVQQLRTFKNLYEQQNRARETGDQDASAQMNAAQNSLITELEQTVKQRNQTIKEYKEDKDEFDSRYELLEDKFNELRKNQRSEGQKLAEFVQEDYNTIEDKSDEVLGLKRQLAEVTKKRDTFEEELAMYENQDRAIREKATQLELQNRRIQQKLALAEADKAKMLEVEKELASERDELLKKLHDTGYTADKYFDELRKTRDMNEKVEKNNTQLKQKLDQADPGIVQEQKDLIISLKNKVNVLEKELHLVTANTSKELDSLRDENSGFKSKQNLVALHNEKTKNAEGDVIQRMTNLLEKSKTELGAAVEQNGKLKNELDVQAAYFEKQIKKLGYQETKIDEIATTDENNPLKDNQRLMNTLEQKNRIIADAEQRLKDAVQEKEGASQLIKTLQNELKLQEKHFNTTNGKQAKYYSSMAEQSLTDQNKVKELMVSYEQNKNELMRYRSVNAAKINEGTHLGKEKVALLEEEIRKQDSFFKLQEQRMNDEVKDLKQEIIRQKTTNNGRNETMDQMVNMAIEIKQVNQRLVGEKDNQSRQLRNLERQLLELKQENQYLKQQSPVKSQKRPPVAPQYNDQSNYGQQQPYPDLSIPQLKRQASDNVSLPDINSGRRSQSVSRGLNEGGMRESYNSITASSRGGMLQYYSPKQTINIK